MDHERVMLVLGATSLVGRFALPRLVEAGWTVAALSRAERPPMDGVSWVRGDVHDAELSLPKAGAALSLSPIWLLPAALPALRMAGVRRVIAFSSTSLFTKAASPDPGERAVAERLAEGERLASAFCDDAGIALTIFRPTMIYAEGQDQNVSRLAGLIRRFGVLPLSRSGAGLRQPVHADDLAQACLQALERPETFGRAYDLPGGETLSYRAMAERIFHGLGRTPCVVPLPPVLWRLAFRVASPSGATTAMGDRMGEDLVFDGGPAAADFGWAPRPFRPRF
jgi:nucleoside-diphosphate-sugar epimerase